MTIIVKTLIFTILVPGSVTVWVPYLLLSSRLGVYSYESGSFRLIGILPIALGSVFYLWCAWDFAVAGKGTPAPLDPPKMLVKRGLYRMVRNPIYVGVLGILVGEAMLFESLTLWGYALVVGLACLPVGWAPGSVLLSDSAGELHRSDVRVPAGPPPSRPATGGDPHLGRTPGP